MQDEITFRPLVEPDYDRVLALWQDAEGVEVAEGDDRRCVALYLQRNPGLSQVAESNGKIISAVLCGHDGRRGLIYHLAVDAAYRGRGIGRQIVERAVNGLRDCGISRVIILVARENAPGRGFWLSQGFDEISGASVLGKSLQ